MQVIQDPCKEKFQPVNSNDENDAQNSSYRIDGFQNIELSASDVADNQVLVLHRRSTVSNIKCCVFDLKLATRRTKKKSSCKQYL